MADVEETLVDLTIEEVKEEVALPLDSKGSEGGVSYENCFVGSFFTTSVVHLQFMRSALANVWHSVEGISIFNLNKGRYLFRLYHIVDTDRIAAGALEFQLSPSYYASAQGWGRSYGCAFVYCGFLGFSHNLPHGFMSEMVAKQLSNFVGHFLEYDMKAISLGLAMGRAFVLFRFFRKNKTLNWGGAFLYELQLGEWRRHRKADLVENNVIQNNTGWASSVGLHSRTSTGPIGGLIQSHITRL
ncbi:hypothetical protein Goklo_026718 [Gossypium klotzschianum]|uniref:DUF4283 domain-containing protein n=1 Tax=Gossypium klotzschianum TaxID=34286 RepID=A0A7J8TVW2_9ROSI|nr:hypothetical protein [Gossypium klotzschianum]